MPFGVQLLSVCQELAELFQVYLTWAKLKDEKISTTNEV